ncbi:MAG: PD40 domain-containing protein [Candidatus Hydrogenedentes bacterium]|nr:PD40 domain-containing protein [Candidatus Hydrogenedentota bacterium]
MILVSACLVFVAASENVAGRIAFLSGTEQPDHRVCLLDAATGDVTPIGPGRRDGAPCWSPDGSRLAFESDAPGGRGIYVVRADGAEGRLLTHTHDWNARPRWSADSTKIAYSGGDGLDQHIIVYDLAQERETVWGGPDVKLVRPVWTWTESLVAARLIPATENLSSEVLIAIALTGSPGKMSTDICAVTPDRIYPLPTQTPPAPKDYVEWAAEPHPKGTAISYESNDGGDREIFVLSAKKGAFDVSNHRAADWNPIWAPDGKWLAFESFRDGRRGVYRVFPDTLRVYPVAVAKDSDNWHPTYSPDGDWLAFVSNRTGDPEIYVADIKGEAVRQLTNHPGHDYAPAWQPKAKP